MTCKSCQHEISDNSKYCSHCGGKVIEGRISFIGTWTEFIIPYLSLDHNFWKTLFHLFYRPELVLKAYIQGARKKYFQPFSFLILSATVSLIFYKFFPLSLEEFSEVFQNGANTSGSDVEKEIEDLNIPLKLSNFIFENYNMVIVATIPLTSIGTYFTFFKKKHNFSEHMVFQSYLQSALGFFSLTSCIFLYQLFELPNMYIMLYVLFSIIYCNWVFIRLYKLNLLQIIWYNVKFLFYMIVLYAIIISVAGFLVGIFLIKNSHP